MVNVSLAYEFSEKALVNVEFTVAAIQKMGHAVVRSRGMIPALGLQPAFQLTLEGIELVLKALVLMSGRNPDTDHDLFRLFDQLDDHDKEVVESIVKKAVGRSASGPLPLGLPNLASASLRGNVPLGENDPTSGYGEMNASQFFQLLSSQWGSQSSQYLGADKGFFVGGKRHRRPVPTKDL